MGREGVDLVGMTLFNTSVTFEEFLGTDHIDECEVRYRLIIQCPQTHSQLLLEAWCGIFIGEWRNYDVTSRKSARCGRKKHYGDQISNLKKILIGQRGTLQSTAVDAGFPTTTLHSNLKAGNLHSHNNIIMPLLTAEKNRE